MKRLIQFTLYVMLIVSLLTIPFDSFSSAFSSTSEEKVLKPNDSWIVKWKNGVHPEFLKTSHVISNMEKVGVYVVRPSDGVQLTEWLDRWRTDPSVEYFHHNQKIDLLAAPDDELFIDQNYLQQIHANEAWDVSTENTSITIAIVDTGIDLEHPDLKDNLISGVNLINYGQLPQDNHGHGTSVAGVIAAIGNNQIGVSGLLWNAKIMPVKALDGNGEGEEDKLGEGILYAVDNGAKIIVLSVGLIRFSPFLKEVSEYAEANGVLMVAAAGNEASVVRYPAAFPTVFAVGAAGPDNRVMLESNYGPEIDIVAPWSVYTTEMGGGYQYNQGTSMSAPQVAGVAALLWSQYPDMQPTEIRNQLRQTAEDIESGGWDSYSGYGLLRADLALQNIYNTDMYEPNNISEQSRKLPLDSMVFGELNTGKDEDWFYVDSEYDGTIGLLFQYMDSTGPSVLIIHYASNQDEGTIYTPLDNEAVQIAVSKGRSRLLVKHTSLDVLTAHQYQLTASFRIYLDDFEDNDRQYKAYSVSPNSGVLEGTFHQLNDQDWFSIDVMDSGSLNVRINTDTTRMDAALLLIKPTGEQIIRDYYGKGFQERITTEVTPGRYYLLVSDVISEEAYPVRGEYSLEIDLSITLTDPNEPNNYDFRSTPLALNQDYQGLIDKTTDEDWYSFDIMSDSYVTLRLRDIPEDIVMSMSVLDNKLNQMSINLNSLEQQELINQQVLPKGTYYVKLSANQGFDHMLYQLDVRAEPLIVGFYDIKAHWAKNSIISLVNQSIISGYGDYTFRPNQFISRAEAVVLISQAIDLNTLTNISFTDISHTHWAYESIRQAVGAGIVTGYNDNSFRPEQSLTRGEMSVMIAKALKMPGSPEVSSYIDVPANHWAAPWINQLQSEGYIHGYGDGTFRPEGEATRAEFVTILLPFREL